LVHLYCFDEADRSLAANLWELAPGNYEALLGPDSEQDGKLDREVWRTSFEVPASSAPRKPMPLSFNLPGQTLAVLKIRAAQ
jgi:hypothetical protein